MLCIDYDKSFISICLPVPNRHKAHFRWAFIPTSRSRLAFYARGINHGATAFLIALDQNAPYLNLNFSSFKEHRESFVYIDRIIVAPSARGQGLTKLLYGDLCGVAWKAGQNHVVCEVNIDPPSPGSDALHLAMGFREVGKAAIYSGTKTVRYYEKILR